MTETKWSWAWQLEWHGDDRSKTVWRPRTGRRSISRPSARWEDEIVAIVVRIEMSRHRGIERDLQKSRLAYGWQWAKSGCRWWFNVIVGHIGTQTSLATAAAEINSKFTLLNKNLSKIVDVMAMAENRNIYSIDIRLNSLSETGDKTIHLKYVPSKIYPAILCITFIRQYYSFHKQPVQ